MKVIVNKQKILIATGRFGISIHPFGTVGKKGIWEGFSEETLYGKDIMSMFVLGLLGVKKIDNLPIKV